MIRLVLAILLGLACASPTEARPGLRVRQSVTKIESERFDGGHEQGSGFVVHADRGGVLVVTAAHVVLGAERIRLYFREWPSRSFTGTTVDINRTDDVAVLLCDSEHVLEAGIRPLALRPLSLRDDGTVVHAVGHPRNALTDWAVQSLRLIGTTKGRLSLEGYVSGGFSGGPILDADSFVLGMVTESIHRDGSAYCTALPSEYIQTYLDALMPPKRVAVAITDPDSLIGTPLDRLQASIEEIIGEAGARITSPEDADLVLRIRINDMTRSVQAQVDSIVTGTVRVWMQAQLVQSRTGAMLDQTQEVGKALEFLDAGATQFHGDPVAAALDAVDEIVSFVSYYLR